MGPKWIGIGFFSFFSSTLFLQLLYTEVRVFSLWVTDKNLHPLAEPVNHYHFKGEANAPAMKNFQP